MKRLMLAAAMVMGFGVCAAHGQVEVKHIQTDQSPIAQGVWAGDTFYLSGQLASSVTPADAAKGTQAVYGDTKDTGCQRLCKDPKSAPGAGAGYEGCR